MKLTLIRFGYHEDCTLGWLYCGSLRLATIEDPWRPDPDGPGGQRRENGLQEGCIPDGLYKLIPHTGPTFKEVWAMVNPSIGVYYMPGDIPKGQRYGRSACLIHGGNTADKVMGCIATGLAHTIREGKHWVTDSQVALGRLRAVLGVANFHELQIRPVAGTIEKL